MYKLIVAVFAFVGALTLMPVLFDWPSRVAFHIGTFAVNFNLLVACAVVWMTFKISSSK